jgi:hypothetical protein
MREQPVPGATTRGQEMRQFAGAQGILAAMGTLDAMGNGGGGQHATVVVDLAWTMPSSAQAPWRRAGRSSRGARGSGTWSPRCKTRHDVGGPPAQTTWATGA